MMDLKEIAHVLEDIADRIERDYPNSAEELRALLASPVAERQPVAEVQHGPFDDVGRPQWVRVVTLGDFDLENFPDGTKFFTSPPAPVAVELPERMEYHRFGQVLTVSNAHVDGWNACLDKVKELNQ